MMGTMGMKARQLTRGIRLSVINFCENYRVEGCEHIEIMYVLL
jgi:hypothetical protein